jgi:thioredoxin-like negative regulator of GroEL
MNSADVASEEYERLALEMLAVEAGDFAEVKDAMRKIIASAPEEADVAFLLSRALAHARDQALGTLTCSSPDRPDCCREASM